MKIMANLWEKMTHLYGHKFTSSFGPSAINEHGGLSDSAQTWASGLSGITGDQLASGLRGCLEREDAWPPTLPEFRGLCLGKGLNEYGLTYTPECYRVSPVSHDKRLSSDERDEMRERGRGHSAKLRESLK